MSLVGFAEYTTMPHERQRSNFRLSALAQPAAASGAANVQRSMMAKLAIALRAASGYTGVPKTCHLRAVADPVS